MSCLKYIAIFGTEIISNPFYDPTNAIIVPFLISASSSHNECNTKNQMLHT